MKTKPLESDMTDFDAWLADLRAEATRRRYGPEYGADADAWRTYFEDGYTPADAIAADEAHG